jgi:hypothetical protein
MWTCYKRKPSRFPWACKGAVKIVNVTFPTFRAALQNRVEPARMNRRHNAHLEEQCHNSKSVIFQKLLKVLKCCNFLWVQRRHNCSPAASFANCVMTLYLLKVHMHTFLSTPITKKCQISSCDSVLLGVRYVGCRKSRAIPSVRKLRTLHEVYQWKRGPWWWIGTFIQVYVRLYQVRKRTV